MKPPEEAKHGLVLNWIEKAGEDLAGAHHLLDVDPPLLGLVAFLAQQATEKYLKAFLVWAQTPFPKTHDIEILLELVSRSNAALAAQLDETIGLTDFAVEPRYPGNLPMLTRQEAEAAVALAEQTHSAVMAQLKDRDLA